MTDNANDTRTWSMLCHLSALAGFIIPAGNVLGPLIVWQIKKNELPGIDEHGKASLNFQLTVLVVNIICGIVFAGTLGMSLLWRPPMQALGAGLGIGLLLLVVNLLSWILAIVAGLRANNGGFYRYPFAIRFIK